MVRYEIKIFTTIAFLIQLSAASISSDDWLTAHNNARANERASNMIPLVWNHDLATLAAQWANQCRWGHRPANQRRRIGGYGYVGENLYGIKGHGAQVNASNVVDVWYVEKNDYKFSAKRCRPGKKCGHYTQVVWAKTCSVGCAVNSCPGIGWYVVCNYGTGGNFNNQYPFIPGVRCSKCPGGRCNRQGLCAIPPKNVKCISKGYATTTEVGLGGFKTSRGHPKSTPIVARHRLPRPPLVVVEKTDDVKLPQYPKATQDKCRYTKGNVIWTTNCPSGTKCLTVCAPKSRSATTHNGRVIAVKDVGPIQCKAHCLQSCDCRITGACSGEKCRPYGPNFWKFTTPYVCSENSLCG